MKKGVIIIAILLIIVASIVAILFIKNGNHKYYELPEVNSFKIVREYPIEDYKEIIIDSKDDISLLRKYVEKLEPLDKGLTEEIIREIVIQYNESISIIFQGSGNGVGICSFYDGESHELCRTPDGFYEWVMKKIK